MAPRKSATTEGTDSTAELHGQITVSRRTFARDTVPQLIAFVSSILVYPIESEARLCMKK